jgi:tRNA A64-2'-O-ribosylphosphate transferase
MPDALSKTIPIWCAVLNQLLFPNASHDLFTPPQVVSRSEHAQITALLPTFLASLYALDISANQLRNHITKPLRPMWITPESNIEEAGGIFAEFHPVICCTVSRRVAGGEISEGGYIQGAGDDTENWACGLTPSIYWENRQILLSTPEHVLPDLIKSLVEAAPISNWALFQCIRPTSILHITTLFGAADNSPERLTVLLLPNITERSTWRATPSRLVVGLGPHKIGSRNLRMALPVIIDFISQVHSQKCLQEAPQNAKQILIACENGKDLSIGVALALLCLLFDDNGNLLTLGCPNPAIDKIFIRRRLGWISTSMPDANPSRATLQSVNSFLMERP